MNSYSPIVYMAALSRRIVPILRPVRRNIVMEVNNYETSELP